MTTIKVGQRYTHKNGHTKYFILEVDEEAGETGKVRFTYANSETRDHGEAVRDLLLFENLIQDLTLIYSGPFFSAVKAVYNGPRKPMTIVPDYVYLSHTNYDSLYRELTDIGYVQIGSADLFEYCGATKETVPLYMKIVSGTIEEIQA